MALPSNQKTVDRVSVEALAENDIQEISYDGTEKASQPLNLSDHLAKLAHLIDFSEDGEDKAGNKSKADSTIALNKKKADSKQTKPWPWEWLRLSLMSSLTEMNVLSDCLSIAKEKRCMILDQVQNNEQPETKTAYILVSRKQALQSAADIFAKGAERIRSIQQEALAKSQKSSEFYSELLQLRQNWRIKKTGQHILGDLSYKTAGSTFWQSGTFEVFKRADDLPGFSAIDVKIPPELEGSAHIQVSIHMTTADDTVSKLSSMLTLPQKVPTCPDETASWQVKLETAQNVLFCKELFSQITREAFKMDATIPHMVANNQVIVHLFPDFKVHIMYCHSNTIDEDAETVTPVSDLTLQVAMHQLLRMQHYRNLHKEPPHPVTTSIGPSKRRRTAGSSALSKTDLIDIDKPDQENILEKIVDIARHIVLRLRAVDTIEHLALTINDPLIQVHTDGFSNQITSSMKVTMMFHNYDQIKTCFSIRILKGTMFCIGKSGHEIELGHEMQRLEDYVLWQVTHLHVQAVYALAKMMGFHVLSSSYSSGSNHTEVFGTNPSILVSTSDGSKAIAVRGNTVSGLEVLTSQCSEDFAEHNQLVVDPQWKLLRRGFKQVDLNKMSGRNFTQKMELLMAAIKN